MVAHAAFGQDETEPTTVNVDRKTDKDGNTVSKTVEYPHDPHINIVRDRTGPRPQTQISGYAQGGTSNPPAGDDGKPTWYSPDGEPEKTPEAMFERDAEVNPRGDGHGARTRFEGDFGTAEGPVYVPADSKSGSKSDG